MIRNRLYAQSRISTTLQYAQRFSCHVYFPKNADAELFLGKHTVAEKLVNNLEE